MITEQDLKPELKLKDILQKCAIDTSKFVERPPVILYIKEVTVSNSYNKRLFTLGNFSCIIGKAKSKKTFLISLLTATLIKGENENFIGSLPEDKSLILYFDTEQSEYDAYNVIKRIEAISGAKKNLRAFNLRSFTPKERCEIIEYAFTVYGNKIGYCVIDGIADLANGINDEEEATRVSSILLRLSKEHNCHISTIIHQNKNDNFATGHLGSSIMKKAEIIISVNKTQDFRISEVRCDMSRGEDFEPFVIIINEQGMPTIGASIPKAKNAIGLNYGDDPAPF